MALRKPDKPRGILNFRDAGSMPGVWRYYPSADLAPFVEHYWTVEWDLPEPQLRETLPHPSIHLVLEAGREELAGIHTKKFSRMIGGTDRVFSVKFLPGGFRPFIDRPVQSERFRTLDDAIEGDPGHDLGIGEMLGRSAHFPDTLIGLAPDIFEMVGERELSAPS